MREYLIVGDIAGEYDALMRLVAQVPETTFILALGDLVDRGPKSKEVVQWFMDNQHRADSIMGNHEHMMIDKVESLGTYGNSIWYDNGGIATMESYDPDSKVHVASNHIAFLSTRKRFFRVEAEEGIPALLATHAAWHPRLPFDEAIGDHSIFDPDFDASVLWNRGEPAKIDWTFQIMGHNSHWGLTKFEDWGICIDTSRSKVLTGFKWPSRALVQVPYANPPLEAHP